MLKISCPGLKLAGLTWPAHHARSCGPCEWCPHHPPLHSVLTQVYFGSPMGKHIHKARLYHEEGHHGWTPGQALTQSSISYPEVRSDQNGPKRMRIPSGISALWLLGQHTLVLCRYWHKEHSQNAELILLSPFSSEGKREGRKWMAQCRHRAISLINSMEFRKREKKLLKGNPFFCAMHN